MTKPDQRIKTFDLPFMSGVEAIWGNNISNEFRRHVHHTYIIGTVENGRRIITHKDGRTEISKHELFILNPGQVHSCRSENLSGHSYKILSISCQALQSMAAQISEKSENPPFFKHIRYDDMALGRKLIRLFTSIETPESDIQIESDLYVFSGDLIMHCSHIPPTLSRIGEQRESIKRVCDHIRNHHTENLSIRELSAIACLSPFHFQREFKKNLGITPHEYLNDFRVSQSRKMLVKSGDIADTAVRLGFVDQSHFSRIFKKTVGIPPGKYARLNRTS